MVMLYYVYFVERCSVGMFSSISSFKYTYNKHNNDYSKQAIWRKKLIDSNCGEFQFEVSV